MRTEVSIADDWSMHRARSIFALGADYWFSDPQFLPKNHIDQTSTSLSLRGHHDPTIIGRGHVRTLVPYSRRDLVSARWTTTSLPNATSSAPLLSTATAYSYAWVLSIATYSDDSRRGAGSHRCSLDYCRYFAHRGTSCTTAFATIWPEPTGLSAPGFSSPDVYWISNVVWLGLQNGSSGLEPTRGSWLELSWCWVNLSGIIYTIICGRQASFFKYCIPRREGRKCGKRKRGLHDITLAYWHGPFIPLPYLSRWIFRLFYDALWPLRLVGYYSNLAIRNAASHIHTQSLVWSSPFICVSLFVMTIIPMFTWNTALSTCTELNCVY